jgi:hypothetical protein
MSTANLLNINDPAYEFWEAMEHRQLLGAMAPLTQAGTWAARFWAMNHQQAQSDAITTSPTWTEPPPPAYPGFLSVSVPANENLQDTHMLNAGQRTWFQFANHQEHYVATAALPQLLTFPFW